jgi:hypothetical protein
VLRDISRARSPWSDDGIDEIFFYWVVILSFSTVVVGYISYAPLLLKAVDALN